MDNDIDQILYDIEIKIFLTQFHYIQYVIW